MKTKLFRVILVFIVFPCLSYAQTGEFGLCLGAANFWGDLGGANKIGRPLFFDLELRLTRPAVGLTYRYNFNGFTAFRMGVYYAQIEGDDALIKLKSYSSGEAFRLYRNLRFKSIILELSGQIEINLMRYEIGRRKYRFAPYIFFGFGGFYFNPKDPDSNTELQPLHTEGQGSVEYPDRKPYKLMQPVAIVGSGFKYNISHNWSLGFEYGHRITWTDYIDDVSKTYPGKAVFDGMHPPDQADLAYSLSRRSVEIEESGDWPSGFWVTTEAGRQRGDPADNDHYVFAGLITLTYTISKGIIYCPKFE